MITSNTLAIYYQPGAYGTFVEWCVNYFTDLSFGEDLPFTPKGSSHKFAGNPCWSLSAYEEMFNNLIEYKFIRGHPGIFNNQYSYEFDLNTFYKNTKKIIVLYMDSKSCLWGLNNQFEKISIYEMGRDINELKHQWINRETEAPIGYFESSLRERVIASLSVKHKEISNQIADTELIEFLANCLKNGSWGGIVKDQVFDHLKIQFPDLLFINIQKLRDNFVETIKEIVLFAGLNLVREDKIDYVHEHWIKLQYHCWKDSIISENKDCDQLTVIDRAYRLYLGVK